METLLELQHTLSYPLGNYQRAHNKINHADRKSAMTHNGTEFSEKETKHSYYQLIQL